MRGGSTTVDHMQSPPPVDARSGTGAAWLTAALAGLAAPALAMVLLAKSAAPAALGVASGPVIALGLMSVGMIASAAAGRLWVGVALALVAGGGLIAIMRVLNMPAPTAPLSVGLAFVIASTSFAARGALFARSASDKGWWIAVGVVAGEAAVVLAAWARPGAIPDWLLALLPAQWASAAIQAALTGPGWASAGAQLLALAGTAAATLLVATLWPRRWPYLVMFGTWLGLSAVVLHHPGPSIQRSDHVIVDPSQDG